MTDDGHQVWTRRQQVAPLTVPIPPSAALGGGAILLAGLAGFGLVVTARVGRLRRHAQALEVAIAARNAELDRERAQLQAAHEALRETKAALEAAQTHLDQMLARSAAADARDAERRAKHVAETAAREADPQDDRDDVDVGGLIGASPAMRHVHAQVRTVAGVDTTVLIEGETGTGKELVARAIHGASRRKDRPFVAINCAGLTESLLASQLFGHRRGTFTGAVSDHVGLFEAAQGGTLLLDEIGDMPMSVQTHLLRVLQEREILRLGDTKPRPIDVRVIAATHRALEDEVARGTFRQDLLYRIRVVRIALPPLRLRTGDIPLLANAFLRQWCRAHGKHLTGVSREAMERLLTHRWPGNVRELMAGMEWAVIRANGSTIQLGDLPPDLVHDGDVPLARSGRMFDAERTLIVDTLTRTGGNRAVAARLLGISRATLYRRLAAIDAIDAIEDGSTDEPRAAALDAIKG